MNDDTRQPERPTTLTPLAEATLTELSQEPLAVNIVLGGGIALKHYDDFRGTQDIDAWWRDARDPETLTRIGETLGKVAQTYAFALEQRQFGATDSFELKGRSGKKEFSFQIAVRDVALAEPLVSSWPPLWIETLQDNIGSKMNALTNRGAPRDFLDIYRVVQDRLLSVETCWQLWQAKNPGASPTQARGQTLSHLRRLQSRRPLTAIADETERQNADALRQWYQGVFLAMEGE